MKYTSLPKIDFNIGLNVNGQPSLELKTVLSALKSRGFNSLKFRTAKSGTEQTLCVQCDDEGSVLSQTERIHLLSCQLDQECIAAVPHGGHPVLVGPESYKWGGCWRAEWWLSVD